MDAPYFFLIALALTFLLCISSLFALRFLPLPKSLRPNRYCDFCAKSVPSASMTTSCESYLNGSASAGGSAAVGTASASSGGGAAAMAVVDRQTGASMMEQLVPEITTHALSYLDYPSLCRLSMTNSAMRKAANDDNAWKALYHKDFTLEQGTVRPRNGWKAYYAATRAIVNVNAPAMSRLWLNADYVKCIHASGQLFSGYNAVIGSWQLAFNWPAVDFEVRDVRARVLTETAWVTMKTYIDMDARLFHVTNVFELHNGRWHMVHHHASDLLQLQAGDVVHQNPHG